MRFQVPTKVYYGPAKITQLKNIVEAELQAVRPFLVTDRGIRQSGIAEKVTSLLPNIPVFDEIEQNPKHPTIDRAGNLVRELKPDLIIGLGGGSALDAAKAIALLATNPGSIEDYEGRAKYKVPPLPVLAIPTTCGTASEVTWVAVITHTERKFKMSIKGPLMFPAVALVDPDLLATLPPSLVASTGMDALTHAIEAYTVKPASHITDIFARASLKYVFQSIEEAYDDIQGNSKARERIMLGSMLAGFAFGNSDVGAVHCIAESVGSMLDTPHGVANAIFLPYVMEFNLPVAARRFAEISRLAGIHEVDDYEAAQLLIQKIKNLSRKLKIPSVKEIGLAETHFQEIAQKSFANNSNPSNPREARVEDYMKILSRAFLDDS
ncbi:MAG: iron-containing alcohol dehydrogenase [Candidatus Aminicenantes bacterium]|nr:MAG: iron-containing alcohol dehydrogenase [Candidatus Aminicenantes bacterium]